MIGAEPAAVASLTSRTLDLLAVFAAAPGRLTLSELSRAAGLSLTTTHRIVGDLTAWGALERGPDGRYQVGLRLWEVASRAPRGLPLREVALPAMEDLYEATHENVQLAVREGLEVVYVERLTGRASVPVLTRVGGRFALHATGVGLVLLAHAPDAVQTDVLAGPLRAWTTSTITDPTRLRAVLAQVRRRGLAISDRQVTDDAMSVACPILDRTDTVVAALSVVVRTGPVGDQGGTGGLTAAALDPAVRTAARAISRALGSSRAGRRPMGSGATA